MPDNQDHLLAENDASKMEDDNDNGNYVEEDANGWDSSSQYMLDSQQLVEAMSLCDEFLRSQSPNRNGVESREIEGKAHLSDYAHLGTENFKRDLEACQALVLDPANIETDTPPDFRLSQLVSYYFCHILPTPDDFFFIFIIVKLSYMYFYRNLDHKKVLVCKE